MKATHSSCRVGSCLPWPRESHHWACGGLHYSQKRRPKPSLRPNLSICDAESTTNTSWRTTKATPTWLGGGFGTRGAERCPGRAHEPPGARRRPGTRLAICHSSDTRRDEQITPRNKKKPSNHQNPCPNKRLFHLSLLILRTLSKLMIPVNPRILTQAHRDRR